LFDEERACRVCGAVDIAISSMISLPGSAMLRHPGQVRLPQIRLSDLGPVSRWSACATGDIDCPSGIGASAPARSQQALEIAGHADRLAERSAAERSPFDQRRVGASVAACSAMISARLQP
jgi:hypothetical protein